MGLLGNGFDDPQSAAIMALAGGLLQGNFGAGLLGANDAFAQHKANALKQQLLQAQIGESQAAAQERAMKIKAAEEAQAAATRKRDAFPGLFRQPGMTGGQAMPQEMNGVPMFSKPMGAAPMQATAGGFDPQAAIQAGYTLDEIPKLAALQNLNRPKATRQMEVDDGRGGKRIALVDDYGQEVAGFAGYTAPVQVNRGGSVDFVKPQAGTSLPMTMSFSDKNAAANLALSRQRLSMDAANGQAGKAPAGYRFKADGALEFIPGGPADPARNGEKMPSEGERKAATLLQRLNGSQAQLSAVLEGTPGAAKPELIPSMIGKLAGSTPANIATSGPRQQVEAAQLDMLDAALTLGTGAAYTKEQLEGYRKSYFPQLGDDKKTVADKQARLQNVIEAAKIAAGRAGGQATVPRQSGASGGWGIQKVN